jgi:hypothetical protein
MAQSPSPTSAQYSVMHNFEQMLAAGTLVNLTGADGEVLLTFEPAKEFQSVVISTPALANGGSYVIYSGGSADGTQVDGLYTGGSYTPGSEAASFTVASVVTSSGVAGGFFGGPGGGRTRPTRP